MSDAYFDGRQIKRIRQILPFAEEVTGDYYRLASFNEKFPYDVTTLGQWPEFKPSPGVFAELCKLSIQKKYPTDRRLDPHMYRICLVDPNIIECLKRRPPLYFRPLMLYILTHELVHVVRFSKYISHFSDEREKEEAKVHKITCDILSEVPMRGLRRILDCYRPPS